MARRPVGRSRSGADREEESIYNRFMAPEVAQPVIRTYNIVVQPPAQGLSGAPAGPPSPGLTSPTYGGKMRMHADSSQVGISLHLNPE